MAAETADGMWVVTSPNADWIPQPIIGPVSVQFREDGRFGVEDPIQWPQVHCQKFAHFAAILRQPLDMNDYRQPIWRTVTLQDFEPLEGCAVGSLGTLGSSFRSDLEPLIVSLSERVQKHCLLNKTTGSRLNFCEVVMRQSFKRLDYPSTFRDIALQVVNVQRYWLECTAWLDWVEILWDDILDNPLSLQHRIRPQYMGTFTTDPGVVQKLLTAGIPVWLLRPPHTLTRSVVIRTILFQFQAPDSVVTSCGVFPSTPLYVGMAGERHLAATCLGGHTYLDVQKVPLPDLSQLPSQAISDSQRALMDAKTTLAAYAAPRTDLGPQKLPSSAQDVSDPSAQSSSASMELVARSKPSRSRQAPCECAINVETCRS